MAYTKKDYFEPVSANNFNSAGGDYKSQSFEALSSYTIDKVVVRIKSSSTKSILYYVRLYAADGSGLPTGGVLATYGSFTLISLQSTYTDEEYTGDSYAVTSGNNYCIVLESANDPDDGWFWFSSSGNDYATGNAATKTFGFSWVAETYDRWFQLFEVIALPSKATNPSPSDSSTSVDFSVLGLSWDDGGGADTFDVYMGPVGALVLVSSAQAGTTFTVDTADVPWGETIYWRIDSTNGAGTITGDTWSFDVVVIRSVKMGANGAFIVVTAKDGVYLSTDSGTNWTRKTPDGVEDTDWEKGICSSDGTYIIVVSSADAIYRSANSGTSWGAITPAGGDTFSVNKMATSDDGQFMVIVGQNSTDPTESCYISADYGATWTAKKPIDTSITWTDCDISNDGTIIAVSRSSYFYISFDSGAAWAEQGMASSAEVWEGLSISGDGTIGLVANTNDNDEFFIGAYTELFSEATWAETTLTSAGRALIDDVDATAQATTLGLGTGDSPVFTGLTLTNATVIGSNSVVFQPNIDSATFLQVLAAAGGTPILNIDTVNGRVGIGMASPVTTLDVEGSLRVKDPATGIYFAFSEVANTERVKAYTSGTTIRFINAGNAYANLGFRGLSLGANYAGILPPLNGIIIQGNVGIGEVTPETLTEWTHAQPYLTLHNSTHEDTDGGRESRLNFKGEQSGGEETTLARIEISHDGTDDDEKGKVVISTNAGSDGDTPTAVMKIDAAGNTYIGDGGATNFLKIEPDGTIEMNGDATVFNDIVVPLSSAKVPAVNAPSWDSFIGNLNAYAYAVNDFQEFSTELMHSYKNAATIEFHVHGAVNGLDGDERTIKCEIEYTIANVSAESGFGDVYPATTTITAELTIPASTTDLTAFSIDIGDDISGNFAQGAIIKGRIRRIASTGSEPSADPFLTEIGIHIESDTIGTRTATSK